MKGFFSKLVKTRKGDTSGAESVAVGSVCEDPPRIVTFEVESNRPKTPGEIEEYEDEEIINTLINMAELIRIAKINKDLKGECITLRHLNKMLCQEYISTRALAEFLVLKSSWREEDGQTTRAEHKTRPKSKNAEQNGRLNALTFQYTTSSIGLIYQFYSVRALVWKVVLGYLPSFKNKWISLMEGNLIRYQDYVVEFVVEHVLRNKRSTKAIKRQLSECGQRRIQTDHPLNREKESKWKNHFQDAELWHRLQKDTMRTRPDCRFFQEEFNVQFSTDTFLNQYELSAKEVHLSKAKGKQTTYYFDCLTRILFIYLKNHPEVTYCQGMNELVSLIFYSFANKNSQYFRRVAESDAYFCFEICMHILNGHQGNGTANTRTANLYQNSQEYSRRFEKTLRKVDLRLYETLEKFGHLTNLKILSIRWFNSLFLSQFSIDESLVLWDGFIAVASLQGIGNAFEERDIGLFDSRITIPDFMLYLALALVHLNRNELYEGDNPLQIFSKITQKPETVLQKAVNLYKIFHRSIY